MDEITMLSEARRRLPAARTALQAATGDMPCSGTSQGGSGTSDRTGRLAIGIIDGIDIAINDTRRLDHLERIIIARCKTGQPWAQELAQVMDIVDRWAPTPHRRRKLDDNLRAAADDLLNKTEDHHNCRSCKRDPGSYGEPHARGMCKSCDRWLQRVLALYDVTIDMPPVALLVIARERGKVTDHDIHNTMTGQKRRT
jgi:hypothetical protein